MKKKVLLIPLVLLLSLGVVAIGCPAPAPEVVPTPVAPAVPEPEVVEVPAAVEWPTRPVEFVILAGIGGGADKYARYMTGLNLKKKYIPYALLPVNRTGGSGAVAMDYVLKQKGNDYCIMITLNSFITTPIMMKGLGFDYKDFTGIALLALDNFPLWTHVGTEWNTWDEFLATAMERSIIVSGTGSKQEDEIVFRLIEQKTGCKPFKYVPYKGGGAVAKALVGQHVEADVNQVSEVGKYYPEFVKLPLAVFQPERLKLTGDLAALNEAPTGHEVGIDLDYNMMRGIFASPGISPEAKAGLVGLFSKMNDDPEWQTFLADRGLVRTFITGDELTAFLDDYYAMHVELIDTLGWEMELQ